MTDDVAFLLCIAKEFHNDTHGCRHDLGDTLYHDLH